MLARGAARATARRSASGLRRRPLCVAKASAPPPPEGSAGAGSLAPALIGASVLGVPAYLAWKVRSDAEWRAEWPKVASALGPFVGAPPPAAPELLPPTVPEASTPEPEPAAAAATEKQPDDGGEEEEEEVPLEDESEGFLVTFSEEEVAETLKAIEDATDAANEAAANAALAAADEEAAAAAAAAATADAVADAEPEVTADMIAEVSAAAAADEESVAATDDAEAEAVAAPEDEPEPEAPAALEEPAAPVAVKSREALDELRASARAVQGEAEAAAAAKIQTLESEVRLDLETVLSQDLTGLDEAGLRRRLVQLTLELRDRNRWEALRMHELTKVHTEELATKYEALLRQLGERYEAVVRDECAREAVEAAAAEIQRSEARLQRITHEREAAWQQRVQERLVQQRDTLRAEMERRVEAAVEETEAAAAAQRDERRAALAALEERVLALDQMLAFHSGYEEFSQRVHRLSLAAFGLAAGLESAAPMAAEVAALRKAGKGDLLVEAVAEALPESVTSEGVPTLLQLHERFGFVSKECRRNALVPEKGGTMLQHALAAATERLTFSAGSDPDAADNSVDARLTRAEKAMRAGNLSLAVEEVGGLEGKLVKETASDWLAKAEERLALQQAVRVVCAHVTTLATSLE